MSFLLYKKRFISLETYNISLHQHPENEIYIKEENAVVDASWGFYKPSYLQKEIKVMQTLKGPNVVRLFDVFKSQSHTYLIQEFCNGGDFRGFLTKKGKLPEADARKVLNDFLNGFSELIKNNFIHRDLKPENMLMNDGSIKIADFGFATQTSQNQMLKTCVGTPLYMSPQILSHKPYTAKSDVWSTGLIYYEMLCGKTPWPARDQLDLIQNIAFAGIG